MKFWKQAALLLMSVFVIGNMTACSGNTHVNDATKEVTPERHSMRILKKESISWKTEPRI